MGWHTAVDNCLHLQQAPPCFETPLSCLDVQELRIESLHAAELVEVGRLTDLRNTANHVAARTLADPAAVRAGSNPVCDAPFHWLHGDHITPYSHTQDTSVQNNRPVCEADNLWRSNNITRGLWPVDNPDSAEDDDRWDEATEVEITFLTELSQFRRSNEAA
jgi:hypothetical protein